MSITSSLRLWSVTTTVAAAAALLSGCGGGGGSTGTSGTPVTSQPTAPNYRPATLAVLPDPVAASGWPVGKADPAPGNASWDALLDAARAARATPCLEATVTGTADRSGRETGNRRLALDRATRAADAIAVEAGWDSDRLHPVSGGVVGAEPAPEYRGVALTFDWSVSCPTR